MIRGLDSSSVPNASQVAQAKAAGFKIWSGYLQTKPNVNIYHAWTKADFNVARQCGSTPIAYCSGWDDPAACKALAAQWNVRLCLDVESSVRGDGSWVQPWLNASGAGLYGNSRVFPGRRAPFFVLAAYPGYDPGKTWPDTQPAVPHGWQYQGTHSLFGIGVDTTNFDDWFGQQPQPPTQGDDVAILFSDQQTGSPTNGQTWIALSGAAHVSTPADEKELIKSLQQPGYAAVLRDGTAQNLINSGGATPAVGGKLTVSGTLDVK